MVQGLIRVEARLKVPGQLDSASPNHKSHPSTPILNTYPYSGRVPCFDRKVDYEGGGDHW